MIIIKAKVNGFRRCGVAHADTVVEHPNDAFTAEQLAVLQAEPMLLVTVVDDPDTTDDEGGEGEKTAKKPAKAKAELNAEGAK